MRHNNLSWLIRNFRHKGYCTLLQGKAKASALSERACVSFRNGIGSAIRRVAMAERDSGLRPFSFWHARSKFLRVSSLRRSLLATLTSTGFVSFSTIKYTLPMVGYILLAEREGFEPSQGLAPL